MKVIRTPDESKATAIISGGVITSITIPSPCGRKLHPELEEMDSKTYRDEYSPVMCNGMETGFYRYSNYDDDDDDDVINEIEYMKLPERPAKYYPLKTMVNFYLFKEEKAGIKHHYNGYSSAPTVTICTENKN